MKNQNRINGSVERIGSMRLIATMLLLSAALLQSCSLVAPSAQLQSAESEQVIKSANDQRQYRHIKLKNNLDVLLISDPVADKAAASLDIYMGSYQNPADREGLAHFLEHMMFLGTQKYPRPDEYQTFISEHGGTHNAYTSFENTNYFFDIDGNHLEQALDRFAHFFISPNFDSAYVNRERNAVESEYRLKIKDDGRRQWDVLREQLNAQHPLSKFTVGNLQSLADSGDRAVRDDLIAMYHQYYSANLMKLVVLGKQSLDELQEMVSSRFADIKDRAMQIQPYGVNFIEPARLPLQINFRPLKESRELSLLFELPRISPHWKTKPAQYLASLMGHEGEGSLLQVLKDRGWAESLAAGISLEDRNGSLFSIDIGLTPEGLDQRNKIVTQVFAWIALIRDSGIQDWRQQEMASMGEIDFRYAEKQDPSRYVSSLASRMHQYNGAELLRGPYISSDFDSKVIKDLANRLNPDNLILMVTAPEIEVDRLSKYYQAPYSVASIDPLLSQEWRSPPTASGLYFLPLKNQFVPTELALIKPKGVRQPVPQILVQQQGLRVWHLENIQFGVPRANIIIDLNTDRMNSIEELTAAELYIDLIKDELNSELYTASLAGLNYSLNANKYGVSIVLGGYSENQQLLLKSILKVFRSPDWSSSRFDRVKQQLLRKKLNSKQDYPFRQVIAQLYSSVQGHWTPLQQVPILENLSLSELQLYSQQLLRGFDIDMIISGNHNLTSANAMIEQLSEVSPKEIDNPLTVARLSEVEVNQFVEIDHEDSVVFQYIQGDDDSIQEQAKLSLIAQMMSAPFFHSLRTEKQLGYVVSAFALPINRVPGIGMIVQSPVAGESGLRLQFQGFIEEFATYIGQLSAAEFTRHQDSVLTNIEEAPKSLGEMNGRFAESLKLGYMDFQYRALFAEAIRKVSVKEIQSAYDRLLLENPRRLWIQTADGERAAEESMDFQWIGKYYSFYF
ncbi:MAG: insulinase family protein [Porticoccaceae bacterium]|nr:insulinase family protein [Porticoccaceae bacterium]